MSCWQRFNHSTCW